MNQPRPSAIGGYEDWPDYVRATPALSPEHDGGRALAETLGVPAAPSALDVRTEWKETVDGVHTARLSWHVGFGPRTTAWFLRPADEEDDLPGILALHCHGGNKFGGADRLVELGAQATEGAVDARKQLYEGRAYASELARAGFAVLAHDTFGWGSRKFALDTPPWRSAAALAGQEALWREAGVEPTAAQRYNALAAEHENTVAKTAGLLGTSFAGMVAHDDLAALGVLSRLPGVDAASLGAAGFSGGGGRAMVLAALSPSVRAYVVSCMMTTFNSLPPSYLDAHSWLMQTPGLWKFADWPLIPSRAAAAPSSLLVQFAAADALFPLAGMEEADQILRGSCSPSQAYSSSWHQGGHVMTAAMQDEAIDFFHTVLGS